MDVKQAFDKFNVGYCSRIDNLPGPNLFVGIDLDGHKFIELREEFKQSNVRSTSVIKVQQFQNNMDKTIRFSLMNDKYYEMFCVFCDDIINEVAQRNMTVFHPAYRRFVGRYNEWKQMFLGMSDKTLSMESVMGLIGEILFLRDYLIKECGLDESTALASWTGQERTHKDFSYQNTWYEVKVVGSGAGIVHISTLEQLESDVPGELVVYRMEKIGETAIGVSLNNLVLEMQGLFKGDDLIRFNKNISSQGYEYNEVYDHEVFKVVDRTHYIVNDDFPRLTIHSVPQGVISAVYEISLASLLSFKIGE